MRQIFFGILLISVLTNCTQKESITFTKELERMGEPPQFFTIRNEKLSTFIANNGTKISIPANAFVLQDGGVPDGKITIEVKEVFEKSDMILNALGTLSDGRLLESFGMIYLHASASGKELKLKDNVSITILIPNRKNGFDGELFYGTQTNSFNWKYAGSTKDTTEFTDAIVKVAGGREYIKRTTYKYVDGRREYVSDTVFTRKSEHDYEYALDEAASAMPTGYEFTISNLGWINCDRFIDVKEKVNVQIELKNYSLPMGYIVFSEINSVMPILFDTAGVAIAEKLPVNRAVDIIVIDKIKDEWMWAKRSLKVGTEDKIVIDSQKISEKELKMELRKLDK